jgi:hypothetical protein
MDKPTFNVMDKPTFNVYSLTIAQAKALLADASEVAEVFSMPGVPSPSGTQGTSLIIGKSYAIRTVTHYYTGRLSQITDTDIVLEDAAWIADTGRWAGFLVNPEFANEVEPFPGPAIVFRGGMIDAAEITILPRKQK